METILQNIDFFTLLNSSIKNQKIGSIRKAKIYYLYYGRNAWYSTRTQKYYNDCMHTSLESAQENAEKTRKQGSVFYIMELPVLVFDTEYYSFLITQINETCPFKDFSLKISKDKHLNDKDIEFFEQKLLKFGSPIENVFIAFDNDNPFWKFKQPSKNSIISLYTKRDSILENLKTSKLKAWKSNSIGQYYFLQWEQIKCSTSHSSVFRLYKKLQNGA